MPPTPALDDADGALADAFFTSEEPPRVSGFKAVSRSQLTNGKIIKVLWSDEGDDSCKCWFGRVVLHNDRRSRIIYFARLADQRGQLVTDLIRHSDGEPYTQPGFLGPGQQVQLHQLEAATLSEVPSILAKFNKDWLSDNTPADIWYRDKRNARPRKGSSSGSPSRPSSDDDNDNDDDDGSPPREAAEEPDEVGLEHGDDSDGATDGTDEAQAGADVDAGLVEALHAAIDDVARSNCADAQVAAVYRTLRVGDRVTYTLRHRTSAALSRYDATVVDDPPGERVIVNYAERHFRLPSSNFIITRLFRRGQEHGPVLSDPALGLASRENVPFAVRHLTKKTEEAHCSTINLVLQHWWKHRNLTLAQAAIDAIHRQAIKKKWSPSTHLTTMGMCLGGFRRLQVYLPTARESPDLLKDLFWKEAMSAVKKKVQKTPRRVPRALPKAAFRTLLPALSPTGRLLLTIAWYTGGRPRCTSKLLTNDVTLTGSKLEVYFRDHKTIGRVGPYLVPTTVTPQDAEFIQQQLLTRSASERLFNQDSRAVDSLISKVGKSLKEIGYEWKSVRRGSLQALARTTLSDTLLLKVSNHTTVKQLSEYLEGRQTKATEDALLEATKALC